MPADAAESPQPDPRPPSSPAEGVGLWRYLRIAARKAWQAHREGRLTLSPRDWLRHLQNLRAELRGRPPEPVAKAARPPEPDAKAEIAQASLAEWRAFRSTGARLRFPCGGEPRVSVLLVLYNQAPLTLRCLQSLRRISEVPLEVVVVDNASTDETGMLLERLEGEGLRVVRNAANVGFLHAVNQAARLARGAHLLLLNNDAELLPGALESALALLESAPDIGAVGGRLILPDGSLQEAGSLIQGDGSCVGYGRGADPESAPYMFQRDVDFCSGAFLLTPRRLFEELGGFDPRFAPAYYEEVDYCVRLWRSGRRVVYQPAATVLHFEFASSPSREEAVRLQVEHRALFADKHRDWLAGRPAFRGPLFARSPNVEDEKRVLFLDDGVPHPHLGGGCPRSREIILALGALGRAVTFYPLSFTEETWEEVYRDLPRTVEVVLGQGPSRLPRFLREREGFYGQILVSRPHNLQRLSWALGELKDWKRPRIVYDAEAVYAPREIAARRLAGEAVEAREEQERIEKEVALARAADAVLSVSHEERDRFLAAGAHNVSVLANALVPSPTSPRFEERSGLLFVGALRDPASPNVDSLLWFVSEVWPQLRERLATPLELTIAGADPAKCIRELAGPGIRVLGKVEDLAPLYARARLFVAPTRLAAGIPIKVQHAAAHGVPVVCTPLLARELGWRDGVEILVGEDASSFAAACARLYQDETTWQTLRSNALARIGQDCSPSGFRAALEQALAGQPGSP